ncbi:MAG TPA: SRPBCC family protein [Casimicrobiaceae bacterium]|nr:SRPBCC family protein [Casimicrobiaceae bacterium]
MQTTHLGRRDVPVIGDQRPPQNGATPPRAPAPKSALRKVRTEKSNAALVEALGWFSVAIGVASLAAPRAVSHLVGAPSHATLTRLVGLRELACGVGLLSGREPQAFLWARVAGDLMDLAMLGTTIERAPMRAIGAMTASLGVTAIDVYAANSVRKAGGSEMLPRDRTVRVEKNLAVGKSPDECYAMWREFENFPRFMHFVESVTTMGATRSHWVARAPGGAKIEWDAEITNDQPGKLIAWRSVDEADVEHAGVVRFEPGRDGRGTWLRVEIQYLPPGGALGAMLAHVMGAVPSEVIEEDVRRFKRLIETGEVPTIEGQPHGKRSLGYGLLRKGRA